MVTAFFVPGAAKGQGSLNPFKHPKTGRVIMPQDKKVKSWRERIAICALEARRETLSEPVAMRMVFLMQKPAKPAHLYPAGKKRDDLDKHQRAVLDAVSGILVDDDARVCAIHAEKVYSRATPGVAIAVGTMEERPCMEDIHRALGSAGLVLVGNEVRWRDA